MNLKRAYSFVGLCSIENHAVLNLVPNINSELQ